MSVLADPNVYGFDRPVEYTSADISAAISSFSSDVYCCATMALPVASPYVVRPRSILVECTPGFSMIVTRTSLFATALGTPITNGLMPETTFGGVPSDYGGAMSDSADHQGGNGGVPYPGTIRLTQGIYDVNDAPQGFQEMNTKESAFMIPASWMRFMKADEIICIRSWAFLRSEVNRTRWKFNVNWVWDEAAA
jgi:hypothetical protein